MVVLYLGLRQKLLQKLDRVQAKALRVCSGAFRTTHTPALLGLGLQYWTRLAGLQHKSAANCLLEDCWEFAKRERKAHFLRHICQLAGNVGLENGSVAELMWAPAPFWLLLEPEVQLDMLGLDKSFVCGQVNEFVALNKETACHIFTDGSKDPRSGKAGLGVYIMNYETGKSMRVFDYVSVFTTALLAIRWALDWIERNKPEMSYIYSDSMAALQAISDHPSGARIDSVVEILCCLHRIELMGSSIVFSWIPSHSGIVGNEAADRLAKKALLETEIEYVVRLGVWVCQCFQSYCVSAMAKGVGE
ncbi:uncharacterized protein LOC114469134 isoform X1 [Gouania willdenowi]|uniref:uncharacterized protein LOC114469134 isoform X1 n=1 Tax=Gouania willdenowi TaxID=441366 RepID=UPI001055F410|nr:uncharacterized protein LOC114469134 isoform X1 [Gouania willdenowi]